MGNCGAGMGCYDDGRSTTNCIAGVIHVVTVFLSLHEERRGKKELRRRDGRKILRVFHIR